MSSSLRIGSKYASVLAKFNPASNILGIASHKTSKTDIFSVDFVRILPRRVDMINSFNFHCEGPGTKMTWCDNDKFLTTHNDSTPQMTIERKFMYDGDLDVFHNIYKNVTRKQITDNKRRDCMNDMLYSGQNICEYKDDELYIVCDIASEYALKNDSIGKKPDEIVLLTYVRGSDILLEVVQYSAKFLGDAKIKYANIFMNEDKTRACVVICDTHSQIWVLPVGKSDKFIKLDTIMNISDYISMEVVNDYGVIAFMRNSHSFDQRSNSLEIYSSLSGLSISKRFFLHSDVKKIIPLKRRTELVVLTDSEIMIVDTK